MRRRFLIASLLLAGCGGGGGGDAPPPIVVRYELGVIGPPVRGVQIGRPFEVRVEFTEIGASTPVAVPAEEVLTIAIGSGAGSLSGTTTVSAGATSVVFDQLVIDSTGDFTLTVSAPNAREPASTAVFTVGDRLALQFSSAPAQVFATRPFAVEVAVVDPQSSLPVNPGYPVEIAVEVGGAGGGTGMASTNAGAPARISGLTTGDGVTATQLTARAFGFDAVVSGVIPVDRLTFTGLTLNGSTVIGGQFQLDATVISATARQPVVLDPPAQIAAVPTAAAGTLGGTTSADTIGATIRIGPMTWDTEGDVTLALTAPGFDTVSTLQRFGFALRTGNLGTTVGLPGEPLGPVEFRLEDAAGVPFAGTADPLDWALVRVSDQVAVASGAASFAAGVATVAPTAPGVAGTYRLVASAGTSPVTVGGDAEAALEVAFTTIGGPGPFVALRSVRLGAPYSDSVDWAALPGTVNQSPRFGLLDGELPAGLVLDQLTGELAGTPTTAGSHSFVLWARQSATELQPLRCALAVFASDESDVDRQPPDFSLPGPHAGQVSVVDDAFGFSSTFDARSYTTAMRLWLPPGSGAPVLVLHRNRNVNHVDYDVLGRHLAGWGIAVASVEDVPSFRDLSGRSPDPTYDLVVVEAGIQSGTAFLEAAIDRIVLRVGAAGDPLEGRIDPARLLVGGHGRGGGSSHAAQHRWLSNHALGYVHLMPFDLRLSPLTVPPGDPMGTPLYPIEAEQPRLPQLVITAEMDGDTFFPLADQLAERATGPSTSVTIYGGVSSHVTDQRVYDQALTTITRAEQQAVIHRYVTAFVRRWADGDRSLDGLLYGDLAAGSTAVGVFTERAMVERVLVDDFQDTDPTRNALGGSNSLSAGSRTELSIYPPLGGFPTLGLRHSIVFLSGVANAAYSTAFASLDVRRARRLAFRIGQATSEGYEWVSVRVRLTDGAGATATVAVWDRLAEVGLLPGYDAASPNVYDRFVGVELPLADFVGVDLADLRSVELLFETDGAVGVERQVYFDDLRFE